MKTIVALLAALCLSAGPAGTADAASRKKAQRHADSYGKAYGTKGRQPSASSNSDYYEHLLDKVPFGSRRWWSTYDEQHGTPN
jgi:hypothetical protein